MPPAVGCAHEGTVVIDPCRIVEAGTHDPLMAGDGLHAGLT